MIDGVRIDSDESGFTLTLEGDFDELCRRYLTNDTAASLTFRLPQDAAFELAAAARTELQPWVDDYQFERAAFERATPEEIADVLRFAPDGDGALAGLDPDDLRELADATRKSRRENA